MLTRDSQLWNVLFAIGLAMATVLIAENDPTSYGLSPVQFRWLQLVAVGLVAAGKLGTSPLPHSEEGGAKITRSGQ
jgi:hypothetical protein